MNDNTNRDAVLLAIWQDPARVFGVEFRQSGMYWENARRDAELDERGKIRLGLVNGGPRINVFYNGSSRPEKCDVFTYLADYVLHTGGFYDTLARCAEIYNVTLQVSNEQREHLRREALAREVAPSLVEALRLNPQGDAARYLTETRGLAIDKHFGELTPQSIQRAVEGLKMRGKSYNPDDLAALGLTENRARQGYNLAIPYYRNGQVVGFLFRDVTGQASNKYMFSTGLSRGGYCDNLAIGEPAVFVEGEIDAVRLTQAGVKNVVAMGNAQMSEATARLLKARNVTQITYVPDYEFDADGHQKTEIIKRAVDAFLSAKVDDEPVVSNLYVAELYAPDGADLHGLKIDADSFGKTNGAEALAGVVELAAPWWSWELDELLRWAKREQAERGDVNIGTFQGKFDALYSKCTNPYERERIKQDVGQGENRAVFEAFGVTPQALADRDAWKRERDYNDRVRAATANLNAAVEKGANPAEIRKIVADLADAQATNTRDTWDKQLVETFDDELRAIREQPDTLKTKWELGNVARSDNGTTKYYHYENIEFWPADITVFCAPTSHGKTMILFQSVLDLLRTTDKTYLYVSCEENKRQLLERALNVSLDVPTTPDGKTSTGEYCFKTGTRKRTIKAVIKGDPAPQEYNPFMGGSEHYDALAASIRRHLANYETNIRPRLKMVHTDDTAEAITSNVTRVVGDLRAQGVEVGAVFVDYMQLLTSENKTFSRHDELKDVCKALHGCASTLDIPVVIAAQLNRQVLADGLDKITVANIGEGADIERIAHDIYLVWQVDKTRKGDYFTTKNPTQNDPAPSPTFNYQQAGERANRIFSRDPLRPNDRELKTGYLYVEQMKARDGKTGGWGLFPFQGERGFIGENDKQKMAE